MKKINLKFGLIVLVIVVFIFSCRKETSETDGVELTETANDDLLAEEAMSVFGEDNDTTSLGLKRGSLNCGTRTTKLSKDSIIVNIDFAEADKEGQLCTEDGVFRAGKVIAKYYFKSPVKKLDSIRYITSNYNRNGVKIKGSKLVIFKDSIVIISVKDAQIRRLNRPTINWSCERTRTQIQGFHTPDNRTDDKFRITGSSYGTNASTKPYKLSIIDPLIVSFGCLYIQKGSVKIERTGKKDALIEYGNGDCDENAKLTIGNWSIDFLLRK
jgi:hypothetical protein